MKLPPHGADLAIGPAPVALPALTGQILRALISASHTAQTPPPPAPRFPLSPPLSSLWP